MVSKMWQRNNPVIEQISDDICRFDFYQAVRLIEGLYMQYAQEHTGLQPGKFPIRFKGNTNLSFYANHIHEIRQNKFDSEKIDILVNFFGLTGIDAPMPDNYAELINKQDRNRASESAMRDFFDLINHRLIKLRYDLRKRVRTGFQPCTNRNDSLHTIIYNLLGLNVGPLRNSLSFQEHALLPFTGLLHGDRRSLHGLELMLNNILTTPVQCRPLTGGWQPIQGEDQNKLGTAGQNQQLGESLTLGKRVWDPQSQFSLRIQPESWEVFESFLPLKSAKHYKQLTGLVEFYTRNQFDYDCIVRINRNLIPESPAKPRLSWSYLLKRTAPDSRYLEVRLQPNALWSESHE